MLLHVTDQELDGSDRDQERDDQADSEDHPFGPRVVEAVAEELQEAPAEHDRNGQEERELGRDGTGCAQQHGADDDRAGTGRARNDRQALEDADGEGFAVRELVERVDLRDDARSVVFGISIGVDRLVGTLLVRRGSTRPSPVRTRMLAKRRVRRGNATTVAQFHNDENDAVDDERRSDDDGGDVFVRHDVRLHPVIQRQADDGSRDGSHDDFRPDIPRRALLLRGLPARERIELVEEQDDDRHDGAKLNDDKERAVERFGHVQLHELVQQHHVAGGRDRQPFGNALDDAEQARLERFEQ